MKIIFFLSVLILPSLHKTFGQDKYRDSLKEKLAYIKEDTSKVNLLYDIGSSYIEFFVGYSSKNNTDSAINYVQKAMLLSSEINYSQGEAKGLLVLAGYNRLIANYSQSISFLFKALDIYEKLNDEYRLADTHMSILATYRDAGDYKKALEHALLAKQIIDKQNRKSPINGFSNQMISILLEEIGNVYHFMNVLDSAELYVRKAIDQNWLIQGAKWNYPFYLLGKIRVKQNKYDEALTSYRIAIPLAVKNGIYKDTLDIYNSIAELYVKKGNADSAIYYAKRITSNWGSILFPAILITASATLADAYTLKHNADSTLKYLQLSKTLQDSIYSNAKQREFQSATFNEQLKQQEVQQQEQKLLNRIIMYSLIVGLIVFVVIALLLYRNNLHKQQAKLKIEKAYNELKTTQTQLIQSEKMASLGELTAGIAHEIQNPLNFVNNFSEVNNELIEELKMKNEKLKIEDEEVKELLNGISENLEKITHHGKRADAIVKGMLQHSRTSSGQKEPIDINALADEYLRLSYHGMRAKDKNFNATLQTDLDNNIGKINVVPQDIGRVLLNLYNNAFYACAERSRSAVNEKNASTGSAGQPFEPTVSVSTKKENEEIFISVRDNGNGIPQNLVDKIFQPFFTTKPTGQGTGLGLSLSYDIIKAHGGEIKVYTNEGEGAEFIVSMPTKENV